MTAATLNGAARCIWAHAVKHASDNCSKLLLFYQPTVCADSFSASPPITARSADKLSLSFAITTLHLHELFAGSALRQSKVTTWNRIYNQLCQRHAIANAWIAATRGNKLRRIVFALVQLKNNNFWSIWLILFVVVGPFCSYWCGVQSSSYANVVIELCLSNILYIQARHTYNYSDVCVCVRRR